METSFANAGEVSPGYSSPWAAPGMPMKALKWLFMRHSPLALRPRLDSEMLGWLLAMLGNCTHARYAVNKERMMRLAEFSRDRLIALRKDTGIEYEQRMLGTLQVFRTQAELDDVAKDIDSLKMAGVPFEILSRAGCVSAEPGLATASQKIVGGLRLPNDETGDCFKFSEKLAALATERGVTFQYGATALHLTVRAGEVDALMTDRGEVHADAYVLALGSYTPGLLRPLGIRLPVYPVKGYSITASIVDDQRAPRSTVMDERYKVAITRLGNRIRVGGMAEIAGFDTALRRRRRDTLELSAGSLFPGAGDLKNASFWCGLRPMTPDGTPVVGGTEIENLFLNTGHGTLGWTMACGSAQVLADAVSGTASAIDTADLAISRYHH
jgi:D-amino-acid dehydrogenase